MLLQSGEFESSKSAMKPRAPEFRALMTILRLVGTGDLHAPVLKRIRHRRDREVLRRRHELEGAARVEPRLDLLAGIEQLAPPPVQRSCRVPTSFSASLVEYLVVPLGGGGVDVHQVLVSFL